jgi:hypothetical protein
MTVEKGGGNISNRIMTIVWFILIIAATSFPWWEYTEFRPQQDAPQNVRSLYVLPAKETIVGKYVDQEYPVTGKTFFATTVTAMLLVTAIVLLVARLILDMLPGTEFFSNVLIIATATSNLLACVIFYLTLSDALWSWPWFMTVFGAAPYKMIPVLYRTSWGLGLGFYLAMVAGSLLIGKAIQMWHPLQRNRGHNGVVKPATSFSLDSLLRYAAPTGGTTEKITS